MRFLLKSTLFSRLQFFILSLVLGVILSSVANGQVATAPSGSGTVADPYSVATLDNLYWVTQNPVSWNKYFVLAADIDASSTSSWHGGAGFFPIGHAGVNFTGSFDGKGYVISNLTINRPQSDNIAFIGVTRNGIEIKNLGLTEITVAGSKNVGGVVGHLGTISISNCYVTGTVSGNENVGGFAGYTCYSYPYNSKPVVNKCYSSVTVSGNKYVGGFGGWIYSTNINNSYATGAAFGNNNTGGFVGVALDGSAYISNCYSSGVVTGGNDHVSGCVGRRNNSHLSNHYYDTETSGRYDNDGRGTPKTTAEMKQQTGFNTWIFDANTWSIVNGSSRPYLSWQKVVVMNGNRIEQNTLSAGYVFNNNASDSGINISDYGFLYKENAVPTFADGTKAGVITGAGLAPGNGSVIPATTLSGLNTGSVYYARSYAVDSRGHIYYGDTYKFYAIGYLTGLGTAASPYQINSLEALSEVSNSSDTWSRYFILTADIDASASATLDGGSGFKPIERFTGSFDGQGHVIRNLTIKRPGVNQIGLFGAILGGEVKNLGFEGGVVNGGNAVGPLAGWLDQHSKVTKCYATAEVAASVNGGGLVGVIVSSTLSDCFATGAVKSLNIAGGLVGTSSQSTVSDCFSSGVVISNQHVGGLIGTNTNSTITRCFYDLETSGKFDDDGRGVPKSNALMKQASTFAGWTFDAAHWSIVDGSSRPYLSWQKAALTNGARDSEKTLTSGYVFNNYASNSGVAIGEYGFLYKKEAIPTLADGTKAGVVSGSGPNPGSGLVIRATTLSGLEVGKLYHARSYAVASNGDVFYGDTFKFFTTSHLTGLGTVASPYLINSLDDLRELSMYAAIWDRHYVLTADLDASPTSTWDGGTGFFPIGNATTVFNGTFDGGGHVISNLTVNRPATNNVGLWGYVINAEIKNLNLEDLAVSGNDSVGALVGRAHDTNVSNCAATGTVTGKASHVGGGLGYSESSNISNCFVAGTVSGQLDNVGGLLGFGHNTSIVKCHSSSQINGRNAVGGMVGQGNTSTISQCHSTGAVNGGVHVGGLSGYSDGSTISDCHAATAVNGQSNVGGLIGAAPNTKLSNCLATGVVTGGSTFGGLAGYVANTTVTNCFYDRDTSGQSDDSGKGKPKVTFELRQQATFTGWTFDSGHWSIDDAKSRPFLSWRKGAAMNGKCADGFILSPGYVFNHHSAGSNITIKEYGFLYKKDSVPKLGNATKIGNNPEAVLAPGSGAELGSAAISGLTSGATYFSRSYAIASNGKVFYGDSVKFTGYNVNFVYPTVATSTPNSISERSVALQGEISALGQPAVLVQHGFCWSVSPYPTTADERTLQGYGKLGSFSSNITGLNPNTTYYVRAYASNSYGSGYSTEKSFVTLKDAPATQAKNIVFEEVTNSSLKLKWSNGSGDGRLVLAKRGSAVNVVPAVGVKYDKPNPAFGFGDQIGSGNYVVYQGTGDSVTVTNLAPNNTYHFRVFEFSLNNAGAPNYNTSSAVGNPNSQIAAIPVLMVNQGSFSSNFGEIKAGTNSETSSFSVSGTMLSGDVTIAAPDGFQVSTSSSSDFGRQVVLVPTGTTLAASSVHVRFSPSADRDSAGQITLTSPYSNTLKVAVSGKGVGLPTLNTDTPSEVTCASARCGGALVSDGNSDSLTVGICWGSKENPTTADASVALKIVTDPAMFYSTISGLEHDAVYHVRAYASNAAGTAYGQNLSFTTLKATIKAGALGYLGKVAVGGVSRTGVYTVSGPGLIAPITITAPIGFELSLTEAADGFAASQTLAPASGGVPPTKVYVRFKPSAVQAYNGFIAHTSPNADQVDVAVSGTGVEKRILNVPGDYASTAAALAAANHGDQISITGTQTENNIIVNKNVTISGENAASSKVSGADSSKVAQGVIFSIESGITATIRNLSISHGKNLNTPGGGIFNRGILTLQYCRLTDNTAVIGGGIASLTDLTIDHCCIDNNRAVSGGGGIFTGVFSIRNSTFSANTANNGAGFMTMSPCANPIDSCTITGNIATAQGGGVFSEHTVILKNTIVAGNQAVEFPDIGCAVDSRDYNLIENVANMPIRGETDNNIYGKNPQLIQLADNGSPVLTHALKSGSPALNAGSTALTLDQRGINRPQGSAADIGAFESRIYTVTFVAGENGSLSGETTQEIHEFNACSPVAAAPNQDFHFLCWTKGGEVYSIEKTLTVATVSGDLTFTANFSQDTFNVIFAVDGPGSLEGETVQAKKYGETCSVVRAVPNRDGSFLKWTGSNGQEYSNQSLIFGPVLSGVHLTAHFSSVKYVISASAGDGGTISPSGEVKAAAGSDLVFTMTPDSGHYLAKVLVDQISVGAVPSYAFKNIGSNHTIHAEFAKVPAETFVITAASGEGGTISPEGVVHVHPGDSAGFVMVPKDDYEVKDVLVDGQSVGAVQSYIFPKIDGNHDIRVEFSKKSLPNYTINATASAGGSISPAGVTSVTEGGGVTYAFTPNSGFRLLRVLMDKVSVGAASSFDFKNVRSDHTIHAVFAEKPDQHVIVTSEVKGMGGTVSPLGSIPVSKGDELTFNVVPNPGWTISDVLVDGSSVGAVAIYNFSDVTAPHSIAASFIPVTHTITATASDHGSISPSGQATVNEGADQTFSFTANSGYALKNVMVDDVPVGAVASYTFHNVDKAHKIHAEFDLPAAKTFTITASGGNGGAISPLGTVKVVSGGSAGFVFPAEKGYRLLNVLVDGVAKGAVPSYLFTKLDGDHTIVAEFAKKSLPSHAIVAIAGENGAILPAGTVSVTDGEDAPFTFIPKAGYRIKRVLVDQASVGAANFFLFKNVQSDHTIKVEFAENPTEQFNVVSRVYSGEGTISPLGVVPVAKGDGITFTMSPKADWMVNDVLVDGTSVGALSTYTFKNVDSVHSIAASFKPVTHVITATANEHGLISPAGKITLNEGSKQTFHFLAAAGYYLKNVIVDDVSVGAARSYTFQNVKNDHKIHAEFAKLEIVHYKISATASAGGSVNPSGEVVVVAGDSATFAITPDPGFMIKDATVDSSSIGMVENYAFTKVASDHSLHAEFIAVPVGEYVIVASAGSGGTIDPEGQITVKDGEDASFAIVAQDEFVVKDVLVDGVSVGSVSSYTFAKVATAHRIQALFAPKIYRMSVSVAGSGSVDPSGEISVEFGASQLLKFTPDSGWHVKNVTIDGADFGPLAEYEFTKVRSDHSVGVEFAEGSLNLYVINATSSNGGTVSPDGRITVRENGSATFTILPEYGKSVKDVLIDGVSVGAVSSYTFSEVVADHTLAVSFEDTGEVPANHCLFGVGTNDPGGGWIYPKSGKYHVPFGSTLTLEALPGDKHVFVSWKIFGEAEMPQATSRIGAITVKGDCKVLAIFEKVLPSLLIATRASPVNGGFVTPGGKVWVEASEELALSAQSQNGFSFKEWLVVKGSGSFDDAELANAHLTPTSDCEIVARFENPELEFTATLSAEGHGVIEPSAETKVAAGALLDLAASAAADSGFLRWSVSGGATVLDPNTAETGVLITGDCEITALFAEKGATVTLSIDETGSGEPIEEKLLKGEKRVLRARAPVRQTFHYWAYQATGQDGETLEVVCPIDNIYAPVTTLAANEDLSVSAVFVKNSMTVESSGSSGVFADLRSNREKRDRIRIMRFPCAATTFDPESEDATVRINGTEYEFPGSSFRQLGERQVWKGVCEAAAGYPSLLIDLEERNWSFKGKKMALAYLNSAEALDLSIAWGTQNSFCRVTPRVGEKWSYRRKRNDQIEKLKVVGEELATFDVRAVQLRLGMVKKSNNRLIVPKFTFLLPPDAEPFDPIEDLAELRVNNVSVILPPDSLQPHRNGGYIFRDSENKLTIFLDLKRGVGHLIINNLERSGLRVEDDKLDIVLRLGDHAGGVRIYLRNERTVLKWGK